MQLQIPDSLSPLSNQEGVVVGKFSTSELIRNWKEWYKIDVSREFEGVDTFFEFQCLQSGLFYFRPKAIAGSGRFYSQCEELPWYYENEKWEFSKVLSLLRKCKIESVLEVGCGTGSFLKKLKNAGITARGIEINKKAVDRALLDSLEVSCELLETFSNRHPEKFDCVVSFQVMEHVVEPVLFLQQQLAALKTKGLLVISVPYGFSPISLDRGNLFEIPPHHMLRWNESAFKYLETVLPIKTKKIIYAPIEKRHYGIYLNALKRRMRLAFFKNFLEKQIVINMISMLLDLGLSKFFRGHTMIAIFEKE